MKTILTSVMAGSLLASLAVAQQPARSAAPGLFSSLHGPRKGRSCEPGKRKLLVDAITIAFQFGSIDLCNGAFTPIGPALPPDVGDGLVPGPGRSLLSLGFTGNLVSIDPSTGQARVVGATGLGDCSTPSSPCGPNSALWIGQSDERYYVTDFANNLYSLDPRTAAARLIGPTGIPPLASVPFSENPDGSVNVFGASFFNFHGKFYAYWAAIAANFAAGTFTTVTPGAIYEINRHTGRATRIAPADAAFSVVVNVNDTVYAFNAWTNQVVILDIMTGHSRDAIELDETVGVVAGAAAARH